jgi:hypothetical protein
MRRRSATSNSQSQRPFRSTNARRDPDTTAQLANDADDPRWESVIVPVASTKPALSAVRIVAIEGDTPRESVNDAATIELAGRFA